MFVMDVRDFAAHRFLTDNGWEPLPPPSGLPASAFKLLANLGRLRPLTAHHVAVLCHPVSGFEPAMAAAAVNEYVRASAAVTQVADLVALQRDRAAARKSKAVTRAFLAQLPDGPTNKLTHTFILPRCVGAPYAAQFAHDTLNELCDVFDAEILSDALKLWEPGGDTSFGAFTYAYQTASAL